MACRWLGTGLFAADVQPIAPRRTKLSCVKAACLWAVVLLASSLPRVSTPSIRIEAPGTKTTSCSFLVYINLANSPETLVSSHQPQSLYHSLNTRSLPHSLLPYLLSTHTQTLFKMRFTVATVVALASFVVADIAEKESKKDKSTVNARDMPTMATPYTSTMTAAATSSSAAPTTAPCSTSTSIYTPAVRSSSTYKPSPPPATTTPCTTKTHHHTSSRHHHHHTTTSAHRHHHTTTPCPTTLTTSKHTTHVPAPSGNHTAGKPPRPTQPMVVTGAASVAGPAAAALVGVAALFLTL